MFSRSLWPHWWRWARRLAPGRSGCIRARLRLRPIRSSLPRATSPRIRPRRSSTTVRAHRRPAGPRRPATSSCRSPSMRVLRSATTSTRCGAATARPTSGFPFDPAVGAVQAGRSTPCRATTSTDGRDRLCVRGGRLLPVLRRRGRRLPGRLRMDAGRMAADRAERRVRSRRRLRLVEPAGHVPAKPAGRRPVARSCTGTSRTTTARLARPRATGRSGTSSTAATPMSS